MNIVYLLTGSNLNNPKIQLQKALAAIAKNIGIVKRKSFIYQTAAWGNTEQSDFLNQVIIIATTLSAEEILENIFLIEKKMGRIRTKKNAPRIIDIDILFFNKEIINSTQLQIPHPLLQQRNFVLTPLNQLSPQFKHPILQKTIHQLFKNCSDQLAVKKYN